MDLGFIWYFPQVLNLSLLWYWIGFQSVSSHLKWKPSIFNFKIGLKIVLMIRTHLTLVFMLNNVPYQYIWKFLLGFYVKYYVNSNQMKTKQSAQIKFKNHVWKYSYYTLIISSFKIIFKNQFRPPSSTTPLFWKKKLGLHITLFYWK